MTNENEDPKHDDVDSPKDETETASHDDQKFSINVETDPSAGEPVFEAAADAVDADNPESGDEADLDEDEDEENAEELQAAAARDENSDDEDLNDEFLAEIEAEESDNVLLEAAAEAVADAPVAEDEGLAISEELTTMGKIEAILFASPKPLRTVEVHELLLDQGHDLKEVQDALDELTEFYRDRAGGFHLKYIKRMGYQFQTTSAAKSLMEKQFSSRPRPLSRASLETLSVVAYRQKSSKVGVTRAEVEFIRGVDAGSIFKTLVERNLLTCVGRKEVAGRPMMFGVTDEFLKIFQLGSINDLPPLESFQTPSDIIQAANEKIAQFEAEEEGVNPEEFLNDEAYTETLGDSEFDILAAQATPYAPTLERIEEIRQDVDASTEEEAALDAIPADILSEMAAESLADATDSEKEAETLAAEDVAVPASIIEGMSISEGLMERLEEGQVAFTAPESPERVLEGASLASEDDEETWEETKAPAFQEEETSVDGPELELSESLPDATSVDLEANPEKPSET